MKPKLPKASKNTEAWKSIFDSLPVLSVIKAEGFFDITADQIKKYGRREPRLMAKVDFREHLPPVMKSEGLGILAISNGIYRIGEFDPFIAIDPIPPASARHVQIPSHLISLRSGALNSESAVLDAALATGVMEQVFGEPVDLTIRGRTRCPVFGFRLGNVPFEVDGVQVEVDGGYEGPSTINLVEAKIGGRANLSLRQILYPHESWEALANGRKRVRTYVCFYQAPVLRFIPVDKKSGLWNADHSSEKCFRFDKRASFDIRSVKSDTSTEPPVRGVPFPQADRFDTVLAMFAIIGDASEHGIELELLSEHFDLVPRQINYYTSALRWLGIVDKADGRIELTSFGRDVYSMSHADRLEALARVIFREPLFHHELHAPGQPPVDAMFDRWSMDGATKPRRMQTVKAWIGYFRQQIED